MWNWIKITIGVFMIFFIFAAGIYVFYENFYGIRDLIVYRYFGIKNVSPFGAFVFLSFCWWFVWFVANLILLKIAKRMEWNEVILSCKIVLCVPVILGVLICPIFL